MRLLVSVRSAAEAAAALEGGAHIIDAKEPRRGSLGPVSASVLREIADVVPQEIPLSVALGDVATAGDAGRALQALDLDPRRGGVFVKLGFAGVGSEPAIGEILTAARETASSSRCRPRVVAVAYADHVHAGVPAPASLCRVAIAAGVSGVLLDTVTKDGRSLTHWLSGPALAACLAEVRGARLLTAVAGGLGIDSLDPVLAARPDVVGVRGAACDGGRNGIVQISQVRRLVTILANNRQAKRHVPTATELFTGHLSY
jgi:uncharacterized protein (UPF0264 family)